MTRLELAETKNNNHKEVHKYNAWLVLVSVNHT